MQKRSYARRRTYRRKAHARFYVIIGALIVALGAGIFFIVQAAADQPGSKESPSAMVVLTPPGTSAAPKPTETPAPTPSPTPTPLPTLAADLAPKAAEGETDPAKFGFETHVYDDNEEKDSYTRPDPVSFSSGGDYSVLQGITTYRGNNYRDTASSYGTANITNGKLKLLQIKKTTSSIGKWSGSACTGQPLIVMWPDKTREKMTSLYSDFKSKQGFTEVIMPSVDGRIYFMELSTGAKTRDPIKIGAPTKGTASLDPRGYPIIYVGQGLNSAGSMTACNDMYVRAYSLIDGKLLYKFGATTRDPKAYRKGWQAYDASPLIDAASDTLIEPGENGVLYTVKLNTVYDPEAGTVKMDPEPIVKYTYTTTRNKKALGGSGVWGMENSPVGWRNYLLFTDNVGMLQCVDLNTMKLVYANDLENDSDVSMLLEEDKAKQNFYLYTGCEFDDTVVNASSSKGTCYARKIDGLTGKILWTTPFNVNTPIDGSIDGGILASPILGKEGTTMEGLIIFTVSNAVLEDNTKTALMVALDKNDGHIVWQIDLYADNHDNSGWTPSSPAAVYSADGKGYIVQCLYKGTVKLIRVDGATENGAAVADSVNVSSLFGGNEPNSFEATPAVFNNTIVVGSRSGHFFYIDIT